MIEFYNVDQLKLYFGEDMKLNQHITIHQPTIGQIVQMGEHQYFALIHTLTAIPSDMIAQLDDIHIDWNDITAFELFSMMAVNMPVETTRIIFGDLDFTKFQIVPKQGVHQHVLHHKQLGFDFDELVYDAVTHYLCVMHGIKKTPKYAGNAKTKRIMIEMAHEDLNIAKKQKPKSQLKTLISTMVNMPGFKYKLRELKQVGFCEFMDSVSRIQIIQSSTALLNGTYMGNIDMKKLDKKQLNYMRDIQ